jgi:hypothetical protein
LQFLACPTNEEIAAWHRCRRLDIEDLDHTVSAKPRRKNST